MSRSEITDKGGTGGWVEVLPTDLNSLIVGQEVKIGEVQTRITKLDMSLDKDRVIGFYTARDVTLKGNPNNFWGRHSHSDIKVWVKGNAPTKSEWFGFKYRVTPEESKLLQEAVFKDGGCWEYESSTHFLNIENTVYWILVDWRGRMNWTETPSSTLPEKDPPRVVAEQAVKKDFVVGKWYKCIEPSASDGLERNKYYKLLNATAVSEGLRFAGKADGCYWSKSRFDINSELDYDPSTVTFNVGDRVEVTSNMSNGNKEKPTFLTSWLIGDIVTIVAVCRSGKYTSFKCNKEGCEYSQELSQCQLKKVVDTDVKDVVKSPSYTGNAVVTGFTKEHVVFLDNPKFNQQEEVNMSIQRRSVKVELFDNDQGLPVEHSLVGSWYDHVTEDSDSVTIQEIISTGEVAEYINQHNAVRIELTDEEILTRTGNAVNLRPIKLKNLTWMVDGRKVN